MAVFYVLVAAIIAWLVIWRAKAREEKERVARLVQYAEDVGRQGYGQCEGNTTLKGGPSLTDDGSDELRLTGDGSYSFNIVGESFYQENLSGICGGKKDKPRPKYVEAVLIHGDKNKHDNKAVRVEVGGAVVGHLSRESARGYRKQLAEVGMAGRDAFCKAMIVGGWKWNNGQSEGDFGVKLDM